MEGCTEGDVMSQAAGRCLRRAAALRSRRGSRGSAEQQQLLLLLLLLIIIIIIIILIMIRNIMHDNTINNNTTNNKLIITITILRCAVTHRSTANLPTNIMDFRGLDSSIILDSRGVEFPGP